MLVKDAMTASVVTVREDQSILEAREILIRKNLISLPVVDDTKRIRGVITIDDIGKASPSDASTLSRYEANYLLGRLKVKDVMGRKVATVAIDDTIEYVAYNLYKTRVNALPVVDENNKLCGIISRSDMFRSFVEMMSMDKDCTRITILADDKVGLVAGITDIFKTKDINIICLVSRSVSDTASEIVIRADLHDKGMDVIEELREAGYNVTDVMVLEGLD